MCFSFIFFTPRCINNIELPRCRPTLSCRPSTWKWRVWTLFTSCLRQPMVVVSTQRATFNEPQISFGLTSKTEHLAEIFKDGQTAAPLKSGFRKQYDSLAPYTKPEPVAVQATGLRTVSSLKPKYHCLSCPEICLNTERKAHTKKTGHGFCK